MNNDSHVFKLLYKSQYTVTRSTVENIIKELNNEIRYQSTVALPNVHTRVRKQHVLDNIERLRKQRDSLMLKYQASEGKSPVSDGGYGVKTEDEDFAQKEIHKSISKADVLKALYIRVWGTTTGFDSARVQKMQPEELDKEIQALQRIFD